MLPDIRTEDGKLHTPKTLYSAWGPVFRVDVVQLGPTTSNYLLVHDGTFGSGIRRFDGNPASIAAYYAKDPRSIPFDVLGTPPPHELIIGSAGGNEILASLAYHAPDIEAVELNPVTVSLLTNHFADYTGHLDEAARRAPAPRRRPFVPRASQDEVQPRLVRRARQLRRHQRGVVGRVRALGELPLHHRDDQDDACNTSPTTASWWCSSASSTSRDRRTGPAATS